MNLMKIEAELRKVENEILECYDVDTGEELEDPTILEEQSLKLRTAAIAKATQYAKVIKDGFFKRMYKKIDDKVNALKREKKDLQRREQWIKAALHEKATEEGGCIVVKEDEKPVLYISPSYSVRRTVDIDKVENDYLKAKVPTMDYNDVSYIVDVLYRTKDSRASQIADSLSSSIIKVCNVTDLPEKHKAIRSSIVPTVKITKGRPKNEQQENTVHS